MTDPLQFFRSVPEFERMLARSDIGGINWSGTETAGGRDDE
jgi:hypothetical protein